MLHLSRLTQFPYRPTFNTLANLTFVLRARQQVQADDAFFLGFTAVCALFIAAYC